jgi:hypothetical protein
MRFLAMLLAGLACCAASGENLLSNPGFETVTNGEPAHWSLFLMPQAGSEARVDGPGLDSERAVSIHHATAYAQEPVNNWSQCVMGDWAGKTLRLTGHIKTDAAGEAALWLQCWSRSPWMVRGFVSTGIETPLTGSRDWTSVSAAVDVPSGTDFIVVRCVLLCAGTAWFDCLSLEEIETETEAAPVPSETPAETAAAV